MKVIGSNVACMNLTMSSTIPCVALLKVYDVNCDRFWLVILINWNSFLSIFGHFKSILVSFSHIVGLFLMYLCRDHSEFYLCSQLYL